MNQAFAEWALSDFSGCDNSEIEAGSVSKPSIWLMGIEHGTYIRDSQSADQTSNMDYSIALQRGWPYNQKAFKLLAALDPDYELKDWVRFAEDKQPFVSGTAGYFKGNLFPYACHKANSWNDKAIRETGFNTKGDYLRWCREHRLPVVASWISKYKPKIIIGVGIGHRGDFSMAVFGEKLILTEHRILKSHKQRLFWIKNNGCMLVVLPHFSSAQGLNSDDLLKESAKFIANLRE
jgi:hypothetical protein